MNKVLQKKLLSYSALATALLAVEKSADAQIVYHQVDTTLGIIDTTQYYFLDLNGDGIYDFSISCLEYPVGISNKTQYSSTQFYTYIKAKGEVFAYSSNKLNKPLRPQSSIANAGSVNISSASITLNKTNLIKSGYMPLKLIANGHTYMGWVRLKLSDYGGEMEISSYAYELNPSNSIVLGDSGCAHQLITPVIALHGTDTLVSTPSTKYQWYLNGVLVTADTTQSLINPQYGLYSVITTDTGGCKTQSSAVNYTQCAANNPSIFISSYAENQFCS